MATLPDDGGRRHYQESRLTQTQQIIDAGTVLWIGAIDDDCRNAISRMAMLVVAAEACEAAVDADDEPALIVVAEALPGRHAAADLERLRRRFPVAAWLRVVGPWCDGEFRSWPPEFAAPRCRQQEAAAWIARQWAELRAGQCPEWGFPATMTDDERLLRNGREQPPAAQVCEGRVHVVGNDAPLTQWLAEICRRRFRHVEIVRSPTDTRPQPELIVWAITAGSAAIELPLNDLRRQFSNAPIVAVANFPRPELVANLHARRIRLVALPMDIEGFMHELSEAPTAAKQ